MKKTLGRVPRTVTMQKQLVCTLHVYLLSIGTVHTKMVHRSMGDAVHAFGLTLCRDRLALESTELRSRRDAVHSVPPGARLVKLGAPKCRRY
jgi:hypothetical protein